MKIAGFNISRPAKQTEPEVVAKAQKIKGNQSPKGVYGVPASSGMVSEEFLADLRWPAAGKVYKEMSYNDAVVGGCIYLIETFVKKAKWKAVTTDVTPAGEEARVFLESCMFDMQDQPWIDFISEVLSMVVYGFSFHEILYKVRRGPLEKDLKFKSKFSDGKIGWQEIPCRAQSTFKEWQFDNNGKPITFIQDTAGLAGGDRGDIEIPIEGNLLFRTKSSKNNPEGFSLLRRAYRSWYFKKFIEELEGIGVERNLAGLPIITPADDVALFDPDNPEMVELLGWATKLVSEIRQDRNHGVVLPSGWKLELLNAKSNSTLDTDTILRRYDNRIAVSMLADLVLIGGDKSGSFALAETKQGLFTASLEALISVICNVMNTYAVPQLFALNNMNLEILPEIATDKLHEATINELAVLLRSMNLDVTKSPELFNFLMDAAGGPTILDPSILAPAGNETAVATGEEPSEPDNTAGTGDSQYEDNIDNSLK